MTADSETITMRRSDAGTAPLMMLCPPDHFTVSYAINPWMEPGAWSSAAGRLSKAAAEGWRRLAETYRSLGCEIDILPAEADHPDLVFTANHAVVLDGKVLLSRYRHPERRGEEPPIRRRFERLLDQGRVRSLHDVPDGVFLEGAGDAVFDASRGHFWMGWGPRTSYGAAGALRQVFGVPVLTLELVDPRFYHLDTCLFVLDGGEVVHFPPAFSEAGRALLRDIVGRDRLITASDEDAGGFAVNAFALGRDVVAGACSERLAAMLGERGYQVRRVPLQPFVLSGGGAYCLTLRLDRTSIR